jgi:hypothetical protein
MIHAGRKRWPGGIEVGAIKLTAVDESLIDLLTGQTLIVLEDHMTHG